MSNERRRQRRKDHRRALRESWAGAPARKGGWTEDGEWDGDDESYREHLRGVICRMAAGDFGVHVDEQGRFRSLLDELPDELIPCLSVGGRPLVLVPVGDEGRAMACAEGVMNEAPHVPLFCRDGDLLTTAPSVPFVEEVVRQSALLLSTLRDR
jgi:hypothetical protein